MTDSTRQDTAILVFRKETFEVKAGMTARDAVTKCNLNPETVLIVRNGELVTDEYILKPGDQIKLVPTISGG
ncbi:MAG: hypothetical protein Kow0077_05220 [Anaerolineae bacterium]